MKTKMRLDFNRDVIMPSLLIMIVYVGWVQSNAEWTTKSHKAKEQEVLYLTALNNKNYKAALNPLEWLLDSVPQLDKAVYIRGDKVYNELEKSADDEMLKREYQEKRLALFDQRLHRFTDKANVLNRKAYAAYCYYKDRPEKYKVLYQLFSRVMCLDTARILRANIAAYPFVTSLYQSEGGSPNEEMVLQHYDKIYAVVDQRKLSRSIQKSADQMLAEVTTIDCSVLNGRFGESFMQSKNNIGKAKKIVRLGMVYQCDHYPFFLEAAKAVNEQEPDGRLSYLIADLLMKQKNLAEAEGYYKQALGLTEEGNRKSDIYYKMALLYQKQGFKTESRSAAINSIAYNPGSTKSYHLIGDLYFNASGLPEETNQKQIAIPKENIFSDKEDLTKNSLHTAQTADIAF